MPKQIMRNEPTTKCASKTKTGDSCKNLPMKGCRYCYIHSIGKLRGVTFFKNFWTHLLAVIGIILTVIGIILSCHFFAVGPTLSNQEKIIKTQQLQSDRLKELYSKIAPTDKPPLSSESDKLVRNGINAVLSASPPIKYRPEDWNASSILDKLEQLTQTAKLHAEQVSRLKEIIVISNWVGDYKRAIRASDSLLALNPNDSFALLHRADAYFEIGLLDNSFRDAMTVLMTNSNVNVEAMFDACTCIGTIYKTQGKLSEAKQMHQRAFELGETHTNTAWKSIALLNLGNVYELEGDLDKAAEYQQTSLSLKNADAPNDRRGIADALSNLANIRMQQNKLEEALLLQTRALNLREKIGYSSGIANSHANISLYLHLQGKLEQALEHAQIALLIRQKIEHKEGLGASYQNIGTIFSDQKNYIEAEKMFIQAMTIFKERDYSRGVGRSCLGLAELYIATGNVKKAIPMYEEARNQFLQAGYQPSVQYVNESLEKYKKSSDQEPK
jgi:tetratricopeptide (TPR) repeat protein